MTDEEKVLRFNFRGSYDDLEPAENGEIMRAFDYDRLAAKLDSANPLDDPRVKALVEAAKGVEGRFSQAAKMFHNTQSWTNEDQDGQPLEDWVFSPIRAALAAIRAQPTPTAAELMARINEGEKQ